MMSENVEMLNKSDVVIANYPGSGASWLSSLLIWLDLFYVSGYDEKLLAKDERRSELVNLRRQFHITALRRPDRLTGAFPEDIRIISTHETPQFFGGKLPNKVVLLVRDGRDAVISHYFAKNSLDELNVTLEQFLNGDSERWGRPSYGWAFFNSAWLNVLPASSIHIIQFEKCKTDTRLEILRLLEFLKIERSIDVIENAIERSSYSAMKRDEDTAIQQNESNSSWPRIMRSGTVGGWRSVAGDSMCSHFDGFPAKVLEYFKYI